MKKSLELSVQGHGHSDWVDSLAAPMRAYIVEVYSDSVFLRVPLEHLEDARSLNAQAIAAALTVELSTQLTQEPGDMFSLRWREAYAQPERHP